ncbi:DMT family transporter [Stackebrandtia nassauensis]|uniref:Integral membrane protein n=1 Tax=Stackebrandtia nassauensis (strain DSM 44728 / CIP 108903 / NRRL B-16338 / NBRC 102104 / LLR-40K-21) TaxID=446470 RepID=D3Q1Z2_STANL|nr:DMT family transporter [Stackebrandtia nassauensis]ADD41859.1 hypothetical protein Snas_2167 [Stackebrandtia nassauensis DSM 44728]
MIWQVAVAVAGAWCIAIGAAAQERPATTAPGGEVARAASLLRLLRDPRWLAGGALTIVGVAAHLVALSAAPVTLVQPLGVSGLLVAVWLAARWRGRYLSGVELLGIVAVTLGLAGLVGTLPHGATTPTHLPAAFLAGLACFAVAAAIVIPRLAARLSPRTRALLLAATAGACFGFGSALARVVAATVSADVSVLWGPTTLIALALFALGGLQLQNAYRTGHFGLAYATLLIADPLIAAAIGLAVLGESLPTTVTAQVIALASAVVTVIGVIVLAGPAKPPTTEGNTTGSTADNHEENNTDVYIDAVPPRS